MLAFALGALSMLLVLAIVGWWAGRRVGAVERVAVEQALALWQLARVSAQAQRQLRAAARQQLR